MLIFLYGPDAYRRTQKQRSIIAEFTEKHPFAPRAHFDFSANPKEEFFRFKNFIANQTIFGNARLATLRNVFAERASLPAEFKKTLKAISETPEISLVQSEERNPPKEFHFLVEPPANSWKFEELSEDDFGLYVKKEAKARGITLAPDAVRTLAQNFSRDTWGLVMELEKLSFLGSADQRIYEALGYAKGFDFMQLINTLAFGDIFVKANAMEHVFSQKEDAAKIFNMLAFHKKDQAIQFADYDVAVKSGKIEYEEAILDWILGGFVRQAG